MSKTLSLLKSAKPLYVLHFSSGKPTIYLIKAGGATLIELSGDLQQFSELTQLATQSPRIPWAILADQSEETFWGNVMPVMRGAAKTAWIERLAAQSGSDSPFRWFELQGKSRSQPDKVRVLGYTLDISDGILPWLEALQNCQARIRGLYSPVMLTPTALPLLKIKPLKNEDAICVLITPHADGLRQSVLVAGKIRFSRLALHPLTTQEQWYETVHREMARLREYLIGNGLLQNERTGMHLYVVSPPAWQSESATKTSTATHAKDQYHWIVNPLSDLIYVAALAKKQVWPQLAPLPFCKVDLSLKFCTLVYTLCSLFTAFALTYAVYFGFEIWQTQSDITAAKVATDITSRQYQEIAKTFPASPLTAPQLIDMSRRWDLIQAEAPPSMLNTLSLVGQILARHPNMSIEEMVWSYETVKDTTQQSLPSPPELATKTPLMTAILVLRGQVRGMTSYDLRGTRDVLARLMIDLNKDKQLRAEVVKQPLDLSTKASLSGSGAQEKSEISFEIKLWQK